MTTPRRSVTLPEGVIIFQLNADPPAGFAVPIKRAFWLSAADFDRIFTGTGKPPLKKKRGKRC